MYSDPLPYWMCGVDTHRRCRLPRGSCGGPRHCCLASPNHNQARQRDVNKAERKLRKKIKNNTYLLSLKIQPNEITTIGLYEVFYSQFFHVLLHSNKVELNIFQNSLSKILNIGWL